MNTDELKVNQRAEVLARMHLINMDTWPIVARDFKNNNLIWTSHDPAGTLTKGDMDTETAIKALHDILPDAMPYHAIDGKYRFSDGTIMHLISLLYVSKHMEEWERDRNDLAAGVPIVYVYNVNMPEFSELGAIRIIENEHAQALQRI